MFWIVLQGKGLPDPRTRARVEVYKGEVLVISEAEDGNEGIVLATDPYHARVLAVEILAALDQADKIRAARGCES